MMVQDLVAESAPLLVETHSPSKVTSSTLSSNNNDLKDEEHVELPKISLAEVQRHTTATSLWVTYQGHVYDVTDFQLDHPGGEELLLQYGGQDITSVMGGGDEAAEHVHSESAYDVLRTYLIGRLKEGESEAAAAKVAASRPVGVPSPQFIDTSKPMMAQVWAGKFSKAFYLEQVHIPRHVKGSAPLFASSWLEPLSKTYWFIIPMFYTPVISYCLHVALNSLPAKEVAGLFLGGIFLWTLIEYTLHRFLFHMEYYLPDHPLALTIHFTMHGVHHFLPMDRLRLVMPPALGMALAWPIWCGIVSLTGKAVGNAVIAGSFLGFVLYDLTHYYFHHGRPFSQYIRNLKTYHMDHHYKDPNLGFGITSKFWDIIFGTLLN